METPLAVAQANAAAANLRAEDDVVFVFLRIGIDYVPSFIVDQGKLRLRYHFPDSR